MAISLTVRCAGLDCARALAVCSVALLLCTGCPAPYPAVPHEELAERILQPPIPPYQQAPDSSQQGQPTGSTMPPTQMGQPADSPMPPAQTQSSAGGPRNSVRTASVAKVQRSNGAGAGVQRSDGVGSNVRQASFTQAEPLPAPGSANNNAPPAVPPRAVDADGPKMNRLEQIHAGNVEGVIDATTLSLATAIDLAYRNNPDIQKAHAKLNLAHSGKDIAYADFLPSLDGGYRFLGGKTNPDGFVLPTIASQIGNVAFGKAADEVGMAELRVQWTVWDFGRTMSKYGQSLVAEQIAGLQLTRTQQTVAFEVTKAYFEALDANAAADIAEEAVRRAQSALSDTKNYLHRGNAIRNDVMRANVFLKDMQLELVKAHTRRE